MKQWTEEEFLNHNRWFHATSNTFCNLILKNGIIANKNKYSELDFGYGFYLASSVEWAKKYATGFENPRILEFHFKPIDLLNGSKNYKFFGELNEEFADFVFHNRMDFEKYDSLCVHNYDLVAGVMSDGTQVTDFEEFRDNEISKKELYRRLLLPKEDWQITLHSQLLCEQIKPYKCFDLLGGEYNVDNYKKTI